MQKKTSKYQNKKSIFCWKKEIKYFFNEKYKKKKQKQKIKFCQNRSIFYQKNQKNQNVVELDVTAPKGIDLRGNRQFC